MVIASYMLDKAREKGYAQGYPEGYAEGYAKGYAQGYAKGYTEGYAQGLAEVRAEAYEYANKRLAAYFKRMDAAREKGEDFNEPPPKFKRKGR